MPGTVLSQMRKLRQRGVKGPVPSHTLGVAKAWDQDESGVPYFLPHMASPFIALFAFGWGFTVIFVFSQFSVSQISTYNTLVRYDYQAHFTDGEAEAPRGDRSRPTGWRPLVCPPVSPRPLTHQRP